MNPYRSHLLRAVVKHFDFLPLPFRCGDEQFFGNHFPFKSRIPHYSFSGLFDRDSHSHALLK